MISRSTTAPAVSDSQPFSKPNTLQAPTVAAGDYPVILTEATAAEFALGINAGLIAAFGAELPLASQAALQRRLLAYTAPGSTSRIRTLRYA